jgi:hypothetical protein
MVSRRQVPGQADLFGDQADKFVPVPEPRGTVSGYGGQPDAVMEVLSEIRDQRYGIIEKTGRVVEINVDRVCRHSEVEEIILHLQKQRYVDEGEMIPCRHGAIIKPVNRFKLTKAGRNLYNRWANLKGVPAQQ